MHPGVAASRLHADNRKLIHCRYFYSKRIWIQAKK
jgi:hypothetical protein